jgi:hypothetical protein
MLIEDEHYRDLYRLQRSRARLALVCGVLYGQLHHIKFMMEKPIAFDPQLKQEIAEAIAENLQLVNPILEEEFYPKPAPPAKAAPPASEQTPKGPEVENPGDQVRVTGGGK